MKHISTVPMIIDGSNFIPRLFEMGIKPKFVANQLSLRAIASTVKTLLNEIEDFSVQTQTVQFICSQKLMGTSSVKFTGAEQQKFLDRIRREIGVYVDVINIKSAQNEKGVDGSVISRLEEIAEKKEAEYCVLVARDKDYIPTLHRLRHRLRIILFDILGDIPSDLSNEAYATITLGKKASALFTYAYLTMPISELDFESCAELYAQTDDRLRNQLRVDEDGSVFFTYEDAGISNLHGIKFRFEIFMPGNGYVGPLAASKDDYINMQLRVILRSWNTGARGLVDVW